MIEPISGTAVVSATMPAAVKATLEGFSDALPKLTKLARGVAEKTAADFRLGFGEYLNVSYNRCRHFKTILNPGKPLEVNKHYVNINFAYDGRSITDLAL